MYIQLQELMNKLKHIFPKYHGIHTFLVVNFVTGIRVEIFYLSNKKAQKIFSAPNISVDKPKF